MEKKTKRNSLDRVLPLVPKIKPENKFLKEEAKKYAYLLGYNYQSSVWYERSYQVFNKDYNPKRVIEEKEMGLIRKKIKALFE